MTSNKALHLVTNMLSAAKIDDACFEAELLLRHLLGISKAQLYCEPERMLTEEEMINLQYLVKRRLSHEPAAYILRCCEFYGIDFYIDQRALIPRPETELLVEEAIRFAHYHSSSGDKLIVADVGTGSGVVAISLAIALPEARIYAMDISASALQVANINCQCHQVNEQVTLLHGDLLGPLPEPVNVIVANLPYIKNGELKTLSPEITNFEPMIALDGGEDGLDRIRSLLDQTLGKIRPQGCLLLEIGQEQEEMVKSLIHNRFPKAMIQLIPDLGGVERVVKVTI
jgi:release factor glutamine methyltransferase